MQILNGYKLTQDNVTLRDVHVKIPAGGQIGISGSKSGGYIDNFTMRRSILSGHFDTPGESIYNEKWGARVYNMRDGRLIDCIIRNIEEEHGWYMGRAGNFRFERVQFRNCGSQGLQDAQREIDSIGGRADNVPCTLEVLACTFDHCAMPQGSRQSWNLSIFGFDENLREWYPDGPLLLTAGGQPQKGHVVRSLTDVIVDGCAFIGNGYPHLASGNRNCDSTGGILIGDRFNASITNCQLNFVRPDRGVIHLRNIENTYIGGCDLTDGDIILSDMDACNVTIENCTGPGNIRRLAPGAHSSTFLAKVSAGYSH